jgi:proteasome lid subunit RPN8/RPN11
MRIPRDIHDQIFAHARADAPDECCGMVGHTGGVARSVRRVTNDAHSPLRFQMNPTEQLKAIEAIEGAELEVAMYHSHTRSAPEPSQTDVNYARWWPGVLWLIAGVSSDQDDLRAFWIEDGEVRQEPLELTG